MAGPRLLDTEITAKPNCAEQVGMHGLGQGQAQGTWNRRGAKCPVDRDVVCALGSWR